MRFALLDRYLDIAVGLLPDASFDHSKQEAPALRGEKSHHLRENFLVALPRVEARADQRPEHQLADFVVGERVDDPPPDMPCADLAGKLGELSHLLFHSAALQRKGRGRLTTRSHYVGHGAHTLGYRVA